MNINDSSEIVDYFQKEGISLIYLDSSELKAATNYLKGDLQNFITAVKALDEKVAFVQIIVLSGSDFYHEPVNEILGDYQRLEDEEDAISSAKQINLIQFSDNLDEFKKYIDQTHFLWFRVFFKNQSLTYLHYADWVEEFNKVYDKAEEIFEAREKDLRQQREKAQVLSREASGRQEAELIQMLELLGDDAKFISLPTQKAKQEYALALHPELSGLQPLRLKDEISKLNARIQARKML